MTERNEANKRVGGDESPEEKEKREERKRRRATDLRRKLSEVPITPVWASQLMFELVTGIKRRHAYELAAAGIVRTKKDGTATRWNVADGLAYVESLPPAKIQLSPAQRKKKAEVHPKANEAGHRAAQKPTS